MRSCIAIPCTVLTAVFVCACGSKAPTQPSTSSSPGSPTSATPVAKLQVKVDDGTSRDVLASMSDVAVDASGSTGTGALTFSIDFGDGTVATSSSAHHTYETAGTFTIAAAVTDAQGRKATDSSAITVKAVTGRWFAAEYVTRSNRVEVHQLSIDSQSSLTVRGQYRTTGASDRTFTGTLTPPRKIEIAISGGAGLLGLLPDRLNDEATPWTLIAQGDSVDGERLDFQAIAGDPTDAPPDAVLKVSFDGGLFGRPFASLTPVRFDGTSSRGTSLKYFIEFGDGTASAGPQATRTVERYATARLTVVDRFGRSDTDSVDYYPFSLEEGALKAYWRSRIGSDDGSRLNVWFTSRNGVTYVGGAAETCFPVTLCDGYTTSATATLSGVRSIRIDVPGKGISFEGTLDSSSQYGAVMTLVQRGGARNGTTWTLMYQEEY